MPQTLSTSVDRRALLANGGTLLAAWLGCNSILAPSGARAADEPAPVSLSGLKGHAPTPLPAIDFTDEGGAARHLADWRGRIVILNLWATWCQPCVAEMPALSCLAARLSATGDIAVLPVSVDRGGAATVRRFYKARAIAGLPVLCDPQMQIPTALREEGVPLSLLVDRQGREVLRIVGPVRWDEAGAEDRIRRLAGGA
ncbi:TlpA family protein disulfide reductase [Gluconacetobacter azotocaptans]|uniref:TlpA family protein disulfide reductase n=1 Tax=Gluconacetobacter azotocaptans TaxID=142834 RepID=UPI00195D1F89|nr:TlpA disulfide reductase family protein [Gluconacetobacter azotocaptans]MBM9403497.1 TlpA family protein disulfide reductase [Gluconacetobacter azotocaptans]